MNPKDKTSLIIRNEVRNAIANRYPVVALETAVLTHGLPHPANIDLSLSLEEEVRAGSAIPATIGVLDGQVIVGLSQDEIKRLGDPKIQKRKISLADFGIAISQKLNGGTTVAGTLKAAHSAGIFVFATGGIGGIHHGSGFDISTDLPALAKTPLIVVCSGAKAILNVPATREYLETQGIPVLGFQTDEFPLFYSGNSGLRVSKRIETPGEAADIAKKHWQFGMDTSVLVVVPPPADIEIPSDDLNNMIQIANREAIEKNIQGGDVTPYLLDRLNTLSKGATVKINLGLLKNNAQVAAKIAAAMKEHGSRIGFI